MIVRSELIGLLRNTIAFETTNPPGRELDLSKYIAEYLSDTTCHIEVQGLGGDRGNVIAVIRGKSREDALMLNGHLDTVPFGDPDSWISPPGTMSERDGRVYARGTSDMKSGLCAALYAFKQFALSGKEPDRDILFVGTADEEVDGIGARAVVEAGWLEHVGSIIIGEPTGNDLGLCTKGTIWLRCEITGKTSHAAYPEQGINAITEAFNLYESLRGHVTISKGHHLLGDSTCTLTQIQAGVKVNVIPDKCVAWIDIRTLPDLCHDDLLRKFREAARLLESSKPGLTVNLHVVNDRMPVSADADCSIARELAHSYYEVCDTKIKPIGASFFTDASIFLKEKQIDVVCFGSGKSDEAHKANESVCIIEYETAAKVYLKLLENLACKS